jgi:DNA invertase Pin-like site-specific DNA recombinase
MKVAIYARVSTDKQDNANQLEQPREFSSKQGWEIVTEYKDIVSGGKSNRPQFEAVMLAASRRKFDLLPVLETGSADQRRDAEDACVSHTARLAGHSVALLHGAICLTPAG